MSSSHFFKCTHDYKFDQNHFFPQRQSILLMNQRDYMILPFRPETKTFINIVTWKIKQTLTAEHL